MTQRQPGAARTGSPGVEAFDVRAALRGVGWLSLLLGIVMEGMFLVLAPAGQNVADLVKQVARAMFICIGLSLGMAALHWRAHAMGLAGLISAPAATYAAFFLHNATETLLGLSASGEGAPAVYVAITKGFQYGCLGAIVGWLGQRRRPGLVAHLLAGLVVGLIFGGLLVILAGQALPSGAHLAQWVVNEILFPTGCAAIIFTGSRLGKRAAG